jgi:two-component system sensor histidine kinase KdpD
LRRTDELKTALLNAVSHDLRTPLATIIASADSLRLSDVKWTDEEIEDFAAAIGQEAHRLNRIVGNLLDLSRIEGGTMRPDKGWHDIASLVNDVISRLRPETAGRNILVDVPDELPPVHLDYIEIDQVLSNLIENAIKYSPEGAPVRIGVRARDNRVQVRVDDQGSGIPPQAMSRLFDPFYRGELGAARPKGVGLGLAVAKGLVEAHDGRIWAKNRPDGGASFGFDLPLETPPLEVVR